MLADLNGDNVVDEIDFDLWELNYGTTNSDGDVNLNGLVDGQDFLIWQQQFGDFILSDLSAIPEPSSLAIYLAAVGLWLGSRRLN